MDSCRAERRCHCRHAVLGLALMGTMGVRPMVSACADYALANSALSGDGDDYRFSAPGRLVAVGDLHGDLSATTAALRATGAIDHTLAWVGGNMTLVQARGLTPTTGTMAGDHMAELLRPRCCPHAAM